jgi:hypothetical protein
VPGTGDQILKYSSIEPRNLIEGEGYMTEGTYVSLRVDRH